MVGAAVGGAVLGPGLAATAAAIPAGRSVLKQRPAPRLAVTLSVVTASLWALITLHAGARWTLPAHLWLAGVAIVLVVTDVRHRRLPNVALAVGGTGLAALLGLAAGLDGRGGAFVNAVAAAAALFALLLAAAVASPAGIGMGDVKLIAVLGLALGYAGVEAVVLGVGLGFVLHAVLAVSLLAASRATRRTRLPLGPALLLGTGVALGWFTPLVAVFAALTR